jgi:hypothetical protein
MADPITAGSIELAQCGKAKCELKQRAKKKDTPTDKDMKIYFAASSECKKHGKQDCKCFVVAAKEIKDAKGKHKRSGEIIVYSGEPDTKNTLDEATQEEKCPPWNDKADIGWVILAQCVQVNDQGKPLQK